MDDVKAYLWTNGGEMSWPGQIGAMVKARRAARIHSESAVSEQLLVEREGSYYDMFGKKVQ